MTRPSFDVERLELRTLFAAAPVFKVVQLVSDQPAIVPALREDSNLVNGWGLAVGPNTKLWSANNGTATATLYDGAGVPDNLVVSIPGGTNPALPTGTVYNGNANAFKVAGNQPSQFLFAGEDGSISAWSPNSADQTKAVLKINNHNKGAIYKGLAITSVNGQDYLLATNFFSGKIEVYNSNFQPAHTGGSWRDTKIPVGYVPFGIQNIGGLIYVTYAAQDFYGESDIKGAGHGYVDVFNADGSLLHRLVKRGTLNSPWGLARIPGGFGKFKRSLAVGNFGDGRVQAFNMETGEFLGYFKKKSNGKPVKIDGLWGLAFGNGTTAGAISDLFFTAGPNTETNGLFGKITMVPDPALLSATPQAASAASVKVAFSTEAVSGHTCDDILGTATPIL